MIEVKNVTKKFKETVALNNVSVSFEKNKIHGLIGRNGSGKTVLLKCICGFLPVNEGEIIVDGKRIGKDVAIAKDVGILIEAPGFLPNYSGLRNLKFLADINGKIKKDTIKEVIASVGLDPNSKKWVGKYSLGMRQRLGIAQAIMEDPSILILDEPTNGLDKNGVQDLRKLLLRLKAQGKTILLASHSSEDIRLLCDTVCEMDHGVLSPASSASEAD